MVEIGKNIAHLRKAQNLSQEELAEKLNVTRQTVSNWERGKAYPDIEMLTMLKETLNTDINSLIYNQGNNRKYNTFRHVPIFKNFLITIIVFFVLIVLMGGVWGMLLQPVIGGGVRESFIYPIYTGIILLAGLVVICTCIILEEIRNYEYNRDKNDDSVE